MAKTKRMVNTRVTGRTIAYVQTVGKKGKLGKAQPVMLTTVRVATAGAKPKKQRKRR